MPVAIAATRRGGRVLLVALHPGETGVPLLDLNLGEIDIITTFAHVWGSDLPEALDVLTSGRAVGKILVRVAD